MVCTICRSRLSALFVVLIIVSTLVYGFYSFRVFDGSRITVSTYTVTATPSSATATHTISTVSTSVVSTYTTTSTYTVATTSTAITATSAPVTTTTLATITTTTTRTTTPPTTTTTSTSTVSIVADSDSDGIPDYLEERYGLDPSKPNPNAAYLMKHGLINYLHIVKLLDNDGVMQENEKILDDLIINNTKILPIKTFQNYLFNITSDGVVASDELSRADNFAFLVSKVFDIISQSNIAKDKVLDTDYSAQLALILGFDAKRAREATAKAIAYYAVAVKDLKLPEEFDALRILTRGSQIEKYGDYLMDFNPIIIKDVTNRNIIIQSKNIPRDVWILARLLSHRPEIITEPKKFEWINRMIQQVAWDIFDSPYGPNSEWIEPTSGKTHHPENLTPTSEKVWQVILGFHDYMDSLPSKLEKDGIGVIFPFHDSDELQKYIADKTNRTIALFYLAALPSATLDKMNYKAKWDEAWNMYRQGLIDKATLGKLLDDALKESIIIGIDAMKKFIEQLPSEYEEIVSKLNSPEWKSFALSWYAQWLADRGNHGLANTVSQFIGTRYPTGPKGTMDELEQIIEDTNINGVTQFLKKTWKYWDLVKFIYGYESGRSQDWGGEWEMYRYGLPIAFKAFGIPADVPRGTFLPGIYTNPDPLLIYAGAPGVEWSIVLPDNIANALRENFPDVVIGFGNYFGLYSCKEGLIRDSSGVNTLLQKIRDIEVYLWKK